MKKYISLAGCIITLLAIASCSSTKVTSSWKAPGTEVKVNSRHVLVLGIMNKGQSHALRSNMEDQLATELRNSGVDATPSSSVFNSRQFNNEQKALRALKNKGYDAVMTISLLNKSKETHYNPGTVYYEPYGPYYGHWWGYYRWRYGSVYTPGYYSEDTKFYWETNLYDLRQDKMLYSVQSESFDPSSIESLGNDYAKNVVKDMMKQGLMVKK